MEYDVPEKVWELTLKLGISGEINKEVYMEEIRRMKDKDKEYEEEEDFQICCSMNILSINIRGEGNRVKRRRYGILIQSGKYDMCFIQEYKLSLIDDYVASSFWGSKEVEWYELGVTGASGGIITLWRKILLCLNYSFRGKGYVCVNAAWKGEVYNFVNVYAPCNTTENRNLWSSLIKIKCIGGGGIGLLKAILTRY